jgi:hypothetical protein
LNGNGKLYSPPGFVVLRSHSLGTLIEWKLSLYCGDFPLVEDFASSHSLGTLIEWKHYYLYLFAEGQVVLFPLAGDIN